MAARPAPEDSAGSGLPVDLRDLVGHRLWVAASQTVGEVFEQFSAHDVDFFCVLEGGAVLGMCAKRDVGMLLGSKYGFSLFAPKPIRKHLLPEAVSVTLGTPIDEVFAAVFAREADHFYDDVILLGREGEFLGLIFTQTLVKLQNRIHVEGIRLLERQRREITLKNAEMEKDLRMSRELQQALLHTGYPRFSPRRPGLAEALRFHHDYRPLGLVGGDFFHVEKVSETAAGVFIADVMGHGVRSAIITAMLRAMLEELDRDEFNDPAGLLAHINLKLVGILRQAEDSAIYATALYCLVDAGKQTIRHAIAGHPPPVHVRRRLGRAEALAHPQPGTVLGIFADAQFYNHETACEPGDAVLAFTDGIAEVENSAGYEFGLAGVCNAVAAVLGLPTPEIFFALIQRAQQHARPGGFADDVCLVGVDLA